MALVDLLEREIFVLDVVDAGLHVFAVVDRGGDYGTSLLHSDTELAGGRLVVREEKTMTDAGAIGDVGKDSAVIIGTENRGDHPGAKGSCCVTRCTLASMRLR